MAGANGRTSQGLALARRVVAKHFPRVATSECERMAWLLVGTEAGRAELRLRGQLAVGPKTYGKGTRDEISEMSGEEMLVLQSLMERKSQLEQMISNIMKSGYESGQAVIGAIKAS